MWGPRKDIFLRVYIDHGSARNYTEKRDILYPCATRRNLINLFTARDITESVLRNKLPYAIARYASPLSSVNVAVHISKTNERSE